MHAMPSTSIVVALTLLVVAAGLTFIRLAKGPTLPDRVIAIDLIGVLMVCLLGVALISFVGTVAYARYIEREGQ